MGTYMGRGVLCGAPPHLFARRDRAGKLAIDLIKSIAAAAVQSATKASTSSSSGSLIN